MSRWFQMLDDLSSAAASVQNVHNVQNQACPSRIEQSEHFEQLEGSGEQTDEFIERAAIAEFDGGVSRADAEWFARLQTAYPQLDGWQFSIDEAGRYLDQKKAAYDSSIVRAM